MNRETNARLAKIMRSIPKEMLKRGLVTSKDDGRTREAVEALAKKGNKMAKNLIASDALESKPTQRVDPKVNAEIEKFVETKLKIAMRRGDIKPATDDGFLKKVQDNFERHA